MIIFGNFITILLRLSTKNHPVYKRGIIDLLPRTYRKQPYIQLRVYLGARGKK